MGRETTPQMGETQIDGRYRQPADLIISTMASSQVAFEWRLDGCQSKID